MIVSNLKECWKSKIKPKLIATFKHLIHCFTLLIFILIGQKVIKQDESKKLPPDPWLEYGTLPTIFLYFLNIIIVLLLPQMIFNFCGLIGYGAYPGKIKQKSNPFPVPFICFRIVTRGNFPTLIKEVVNKNIRTCTQAALKRFKFEIVTDYAINLEAVDFRIREIVVPSSYKTRTGALYKARALQYCLEDDVNQLNGQDWIVHLDEETLLTENCVNGIVNFIQDGKHCFGQGCTYNYSNVSNCITSLTESFRVSEILGTLRFQFSMFHRPFFSWNGSFMVAQMHAERAVSFDNGFEGSISEELFFTMLARSEGYTFDFIEGELIKESSYNFIDYIRQRKQWLQGILLVIGCRRISRRHKFLLLFGIYSWLIVCPLWTINVVIAPFYPISCPHIVNMVYAFVAAMVVYMHVFGVVKSFTVYNFGYKKLFIAVLRVICMIPMNFIVESFVIFWALFSRKYKFYSLRK